jgi:hypothetical protein
LGAAFAAALLAGGCAPSLRALATGDQVPTEKERGLIEHRNGVTVGVAFAGFPPVASKHELIAFGLEIQNHTAQPIVFNLAQARLGIWIGDRWLERPAIDPDVLSRSAGAANLTAAPAAIEFPRTDLARYRRCRRLRYYPGYPTYYYGYGFGWYPYYDYHDSAYYVYEQQRQAASFLARLYRTRPTAPNEVLDGFIVFAQPIEDDVRYRVRIPVAAAPSPTPTQPANALAAPLLFEFYFVGK